ncbi:response regulator [Roseovarius aestuarii]|uniref:Response regulator rcp1 n=1 Tax=Roseovarius aestuarii TaxID=475083 RepID=A0A1X7BTH9_9RHOB|nr:response regulator [Roseovarius aestuarii]SMC12976.1 Response regulator rcp1 [Roseovarius aestuarii]
MIDFEPVKFLIVDDDEVSVIKIKRAIAKAKLGNPVRVANDGIEALEILRGDGGQEKITPPYIVTLDINMPRMDGHEFLQEIRNDTRLKNVLVFVLTTSSNEADIRAAYDRNVAGYILKENSESDLIDKINMIENFSNLVVLPK